MQDDPNHAPDSAFAIATDVLVTPEVLDALLAAMDAQETPTDAAGPLADKLFAVIDQAFRDKFSPLPYVHKTIRGICTAVAAGICTMAVAGIDVPVTGVLYGHTKPTVGDPYHVRFPVTLPPEGARLIDGPVPWGAPWIKVPGALWLYYSTGHVTGFTVVIDEDVEIHIPTGGLQVWRIAWPPGPAPDVGELLVETTSLQDQFLGIDGTGLIWIARNLPGGATLGGHVVQQFDLLPYHSDTPLWTAGTTVHLDPAEFPAAVDMTTGISRVLTFTPTIRDYDLCFQDKVVVPEDGFEVDNHDCVPNFQDILFTYQARSGAGLGTQSPLGALILWDGTIVRFSASDVHEFVGIGTATWTAFQDVPDNVSFEQFGAQAVWTWTVADGGGIGQVTFSASAIFDDPHAAVTPYGSVREWIGFHPLLNSPPVQPPITRSLYDFQGGPVALGDLSTVTQGLLAVGPAGDGAAGRRYVGWWQGTEGNLYALKAPGEGWASFPAGVPRGPADFVNVRATDRTLGNFLVTVDGATSLAVYSLDGGGQWLNVPGDWAGRVGAGLDPADHSIPNGFITDVG